MVVSGNLFDSALVKTCVISEEFRRQYLSTPGSEECFVARAIVFDGPEDYRRRIDDPELHIDETCMLVVGQRRTRGVSGFGRSGQYDSTWPLGEPRREGAAAVSGDGSRAGTSDSPSILNASPESAAGGNLAILRTGDQVKVDLKHCRVDLVASDEEINQRRAALKPTELKDAFALAADVPRKRGAARNRSLPGVRGGLPRPAQSCAAALALADRSLVKAILIPHPAHFEFTTVEDPQCGPNEVVVRTAYCGLCGTDLEILRGSIQRASPLPRWFRAPIGPVIEEEVGKNRGRTGAWVIASRWKAICLRQVRARCRAGSNNLCVKHEQIGMTHNGD